MKCLQFPQFPSAKFETTQPRAPPHLSPPPSAPTRNCDPVPNLFTVWDNFADLQFCSFAMLQFWYSLVCYQIVPSLSIFASKLFLNGASC